MKLYFEARNNFNLKASQDNSYIYYLLVVNLIFILNPLLSIFSQIIFIWNDKNIRQLQFINLIAHLALLLGLINTTKIPASDMQDYVQWFYDAQGSNFWEYIWLEGKEPLYHAVVYMLSNVFLGNKNAFVISLTFISYFLVLYSLVYLGKKIQLNQKIMIGIIVTTAFFPQLFSISMHVIRQFLAGSILTYFFAILICVGKKKWSLLLIATLIHTSALIFVPFLFIPGLAKPLTIRQMIYGLLAITISFSAIISILPIILNLFDNVLLSYVASRVSQREFYELDSFSFMPIVMIIFIVGSLYYKSSINTLRPYNIHIKYYNLFTSVIFFIALFSLFANIFPPTRELSSRFLFYLYFLVPIFIVFLCFKMRLVTICFPLIMVFWFIYLLYVLENGAWQYEYYLEELAYPVFF